MRITTPLTGETIKQLKAGDSVFLTGTIYTARDAAHKRLVELLEEGKELPIDVKNQVFYYAGPAPAAPGEVIGSCGPTTAYRMDAYAPTLLDVGLKGMIGKGRRNQDVKSAIIRNNGIYLGAIGGAGALISSCIKKAKIIAFEDLGTEALRELYVEDMPLTVIIDCEGHDLYEIGRENYLRREKND